MHIGYIVSLKQPGLIAWIYREMVALEQLGVRVSVFPTKYFVGPYMPKENWFTARWTPLNLLFSNVILLFTRPLTYLSVLMRAIRFNAVPEFFLAGFFGLHMKKMGVDRIHCHLGDKKLYVGYFCQLFLVNIKLSVTIHAHELYANPNLKLFPVALNACDHIICIADLNKKILNQKWGIVDEKIHVNRLFGFSDDQKRDPAIILCVGRFEQKKGHDVLLDAVAQLVEENFDIEVWLAGSPVPGQNGVDVLGYAEKLGIENRVVSFGEVGEKILKVLYRECDIFCLLSRHDEKGVPEGIPVVLMEAMSMGKPVVATSTGATEELVKEILVEEEDAQAAADAIRSLINYPDTRRSMGENNKEIVKTSYNKKNINHLFKILSS